MHPADCPGAPGVPGWDYETHPNAAVVGDRCKAILIALRSGQVDAGASTQNTTGQHRDMFSGLTPNECPYFAGHYRGEEFRCLKYYRVGVQADPRVGTSPERVAYEMTNLEQNILRSGFSAMSAAFAIPDARLSPTEKLYYLTVFVCKVLEEFLRIHPYANGNGHMGRLIVWLILSKFGYWPKKWPLDDRPNYSDLLTLHRNGSPEHLEAFVLNAICG